MLYYDDDDDLLWLWYKYRGGVEINEFFYLRMFLLIGGGFWIIFKVIIYM